MNSSYYNIQDIYDLVSQLNFEIDEILGDLNEYCVDISSNGNLTIIYFNEVELWRSDWDVREYCEETDSYEPIEPFLRKKLNEEIDNLKKLKF